MEERVLFLKNAILGKKVGAVASSSRYVIKAVLKNISGQTLNNVIEYGAGDGVLTRELLKHLAPKGRMLVVEMDNNFIDILKKINDPRLIIVSGKMQDISKNPEMYGIDHPDLVVSSVPFSLISKKERDEFVSSTHGSLTDSGKLVVFHQYSLLMSEPLRKYFKNVKSVFEPRNILPCFIMCAHKNI